MNEFTFISTRFHVGNEKHVSLWKEPSFCNNKNDNFAFSQKGTRIIHNQTETVIKISKFLENVQFILILKNIFVNFFKKIASVLFRHVQW